MSVGQHGRVEREPSARATGGHLQAVDERLEGMCGALTIKSPLRSNTAQLKSNRSFTFTLIAVFRSVIPICSAIPMNRPLNTSR